MAAQTGASLADLMARMGHANLRAAMIYQHDTEQASQAIADALNERVNLHRREADDEDREAGPAAEPGDQFAAN